MKLGQTGGRPGGKFETDHPVRVQLIGRKFHGTATFVLGMAMRLEEIAAAGPVNDTRLPRGPGSARSARAENIVDGQHAARWPTETYDVVRFQSL